MIWRYIFFDTRFVGLIFSLFQQSNHLSFIYYFRHFKKNHSISLKNRIHLFSSLQMDVIMIFNLSIFCKDDELYIDISNP